jgi:cytochrome c553
MKSFSTLVLVAFMALTTAVKAQSIEEKAQLCAACHGESGVPSEQSFPVPAIWGQNLGYLFFQLRDFKSGARKNEQMTPVAEALESDDLMPLAQYFSQKPWPNLKQPHVADEAVVVARRVNASAACTSCHREGFRGDRMQPRLAGQVSAYLKKAMTDFSTGARGNNPGMTGLTKGLAEREIAAMVAWLAGM